MAARYVATAEERAAQQVVESLAWLRWQRERIVLLRRGGDAFWGHLVDRLSESGIAVHDLAVAADDRQLYYRADRAPVIDARLHAGDLFLHHDPFLATGGDATCDDIRALARLGVACVSLEYPSGRFATHQVRSTYLRALAVPASRISGRAQRARQSLAGTRKLTIRCGARALTIGRINAVWDDRTAPRNGDQLLQLPLGEVWVLPDPASVNGQVLATTGRDKQHVLTVVSGRVVDAGWVSGEVVEVGIGVNPDAWPLPTALAEKANARLHLGFGDSALLGGDRVRPWHADVMLAAGSHLCPEHAVRGGKERDCWSERSPLLLT